MFEKYVSISFLDTVSMQKLYAPTPYL